MPPSKVASKLVNNLDYFFLPPRFEIAAMIAGWQTINMDSPDSDEDA